MIALDTNLLVYAHRSDSELHGPAARAVRSLAESPQPWAIPWPCIHEFLAVVTHPRIYDPPSTPTQALDQVAAWIASPSLLLLAEPDGYWAKLRETVQDGRVTGPRVHDARVASLCLAHRIEELWTLDRDFSRFSLRTRNPI
ncbi:MAG: type II toxin-antitoxin system VapC family toxin [Acidimicrobiales bacterium]